MPWEGMGQKEKEMGKSWSERDEGGKTERKQRQVPGFLLRAHPLMLCLFYVSHSEPVPNSTVVNGNHSINVTGSFFPFTLIGLSQAFIFHPSLYIHTQIKEYKHDFRIASTVPSTVIQY